MYDDKDQTFPMFTPEVKEVNGVTWICINGLKCDGVHHYYTNPFVARSQPVVAWR